ncbi:hypothetical protein ABZ468_50110 [Streptomyces sp. NPDC005708]|uniref:hypothetical protein n=1 Tax=Streptomyces sp. NPDC005708 TaxID=3154564 RepID=UPI0033D332BF
MKEIRVQVDDGTFEGIEERAAAAGMPVSEFAGQVLTEAEQKRRFLAAAQRFTALLTPAFTEAFGYPEANRGVAAA